MKILISIPREALSCDAFLSLERAVPSLCTNAMVPNVGKPLGSSDKPEEMVDKHFDMGLHWCQPSLLLPQNLQRLTISTVSRISVFA